MRTRALILAGAAAWQVLAACGTEPPSAKESPAAPSSAETPLRYVALGDSLVTTFGGASVAYPTLFGEAVAEALGREVIVENEATPGISSGTLAIQLRQPWLQDKLREAEIVTVQISGNDFRSANDAALQGDCAASGDLSCHEEALEGIKENLEAIVQEILSLRGTSDTIIRIIDNFDEFPDNEVMESYGFPEDYSETIRPIIRKWNRFTCELAERNDIPCVSLYEAFNGPRGTESPFQKGLLAADGDHLSDKGHEAVAAELAELGFAPLA
jgi:lysophospholipase L1-like esterase